MFYKKDRIKDDYDFVSPKRISSKSVLAVIGAFAVGSLLIKETSLYNVKNTLRDMFDGYDDNDKIALIRPKNANELFCPAPGHEIVPLKDRFDDPLRDIRQNYAKGYSLFWVPENDRQTLSFEFEMNANQSGKAGKWIQDIPQDIIKNPEITFILSGHASDDLRGICKPRLAGGLQCPDNYDELSKRLDTVNKRIVDQRLENIKRDLVALGINESRVILRNYGHRFNRRAVDVEVCWPDTQPPRFDTHEP